MMRRAPLLMVAWLLASSCLAGERHAVLVGVSQVKAAKPSPVLHGIANDLLLGREMAQQLGVDAGNTKVFSDIGMGDPATRANVTRALQELQEKTLPGDFVLLYLSGHGVQQPVRSPSDSELDRLEEIFLLEDSLPAVLGSSVLNVLGDKEIKRWLAALDGKAVTVWMVADTCHAGSIARSLLDWNDEELFFRGFKGLRSMWLGIRNGVRKGGSDTGETTGDRVRPSLFPHVSVFMAADEAGSALEVELRHDGRKVGLFTWALNKALMRSSLPVTVERLAQETLAQYRDYPAWVVRPVFETGKQNSIP